MTTHPPVIALARAKKTESFHHGWCLIFVRTRFGVGPKALTANDGYELTEIRHPKSTPPPGVPVWWHDDTLGHVAISCGGGRVISSDWPRTGSVGRVGIARLTEKWGKVYKGWSEDINGVNIMKTPKVHFDTLVEAADPKHHGETVSPHAKNAVAIVEAALFCEGLLDQQYVFDGDFGNRSLTAYAGWQRKVGLEGKTPNGLPGRESLEKLATKYGFTVHD